MFTLADICTIAIQIERNGEKAYRKSAAATKVPEVARVLEMLADDEANHLNWFEKMDAAQTVDIKDERIARIGRDLLEDMMAAQTFSLDPEELAGTDSPKSMLDQSIEFEEDTILFYEMLSGFLDNEQTKQQLDKIIEEERTHIDKLKAVLALYQEQENRVS